MKQNAGCLPVPRWVAGVAATVRSLIANWMGRSNVRVILKHPPPVLGHPPPTTWSGSEDHGGGTNTPLMVYGLLRMTNPP